MVVLSLVLMCIPSEYRQKIWNKLIIPYKLVYVADMKDVISEYGDRMRVFYNNGIAHGREAYIAHGGGVGEFCYKNCLEGVLDSINKGFKYIEIDFLQTVDGHLIGGHSWQEFAHLVGKKIDEVQAMPLSEIKKLKIEGKYSVLTASDVNSIMEANREWILVTDKTNNFKLLLHEIPFTDRMLVETLGGMYDYKLAIEAGVTYPIFTAGNIEIVEKYEFPIVILDAKLLNDRNNVDRIKKLHNKGITILVWNASVCDRPEFITEHLGNGVSLIYTDTWFPNGNSPLKSLPSHKSYGRQ